MMTDIYFFSYIFVFVCRLAFDAKMWACSKFQTKKKREKMQTHDKCLQTRAPRLFCFSSCRLSACPVDFGQNRTNLVHCHLEAFELYTMTHTHDVRISPDINISPDHPRKSWITANQKLSIKYKMYSNSFTCQEARRSIFNISRLALRTSSFHLIKCE